MDNLSRSQELELSSSLSGAEAPSQQEAAEAIIPDDIINELLGTVTGQSAESDSEAEPEGTPDTPATLNALAKQAGLSPEALYKATISLPDEQGTVTLEELKNQATKYRKGEAQHQALSNEQTEFANQKMRYMGELQQAALAIPKEQWTEEARARVGAFIQQQQVLEDRVLLAGLPQWQDEAVKANDTDAIKAFIAGEYGAPAQAWDQPAPAWIRKLVYDHWQLHERIKGISSRRKSSKATANKRNVDTKAADTSTGAVQRAHAGGDKIDSIARLLQE